jgi:hypothetical protein
MLLDLQGNQEEKIERIDEYLTWATDEAIFSVVYSGLENAWASFAVSPNTWLGEICYYLAKRPEGSKYRDQLIKNGLALIEKTVEVTQKLPFANMYAKKKLANMKCLEKQVHENAE